MITEKNVKQRVWHAAWNGPRLAILEAVYPAPSGPQRAVILVDGTPEVVDATDVFVRASDACNAASAKANAEAFGKMKQLMEYARLAAECSRKEVKEEASGTPQVTP